MRSSRGLSFTSAIAVGLGAVLLLGACTPEETEPTPSASPTVEEPTPTPTPTTPPEAIAPERPAEMAEISVAGAEAAATYFLQLYPYAYATGDLAELRALSHPECGFCSSVVENVERQAASGETNEGSAIDIQSVVGLETTPGVWYEVDAVFVEGPSTRRDSAGAVVSERTQAEKVSATFALLPSGTSWLIRAVEVVSAEQLP